MVPSFWDDSCGVQWATYIMCVYVVSVTLTARTASLRIFLVDVRPVSIVLRARATRVVSPVEGERGRVLLAQLSAGRRGAHRNTASCPASVDASCALGTTRLNATSGRRGRSRIFAMLLKICTLPSRSRQSYVCRPPLLLPLVGLLHQPSM